MTLTIGSVADLRVGDIGFTRILGGVGAGVLAGQTAIDLAALLRGRPGASAGWITHAYIVTQAPGDGTAAIVEAMPSGAREVWINDHIGPGRAYVRLAGLDADHYEIAAEQAQQMIGTPYGFAQYVAIAGLTLSGGTDANPRGALARYVQRRYPATHRPRRAICSQLVDEAYRLAGVHLFDDGRPPAYVTPGALFWRAAQLGDVCVC